MTGDFFAVILHGSMILTKKILGNGQIFEKLEGEAGKTFSIFYRRAKGVVSMFPALWHLCRVCPVGHVAEYGGYVAGH
jgi:hypothetical protein